MLPLAVLLKPHCCRAAVLQVGEYGLRNKRELWRVQMALSKMRNAARNLLTEDEGSTRRLFEGERGGCTS